MKIQQPNSSLSTEYRIVMVIIVIVQVHDSIRAVLSKAML